MRYLLVISFFLQINKICSQKNIINNGSFESHSCCPSAGANWNCISGWDNVSKNTGFGLWGTPDYYHTCGINGYAPPATVAGTCSPHTGLGMAGMVFYNVPYPDQREYLSSELCVAMIPGNTYTCSFWITSGQGIKSPWTISGIGLHFSVNPLNQIGYGVINVMPQGEIVTNVTSTSWMKFSFTVNPTANWKYITLGSFKDDANSNVTATFSSTGGPTSAYANYFIDDIEVLSPISMDSTSHYNSQKTVCKGENIILTSAGQLPFTWSSSSWTFTSNSPTISIIANLTSNYSVESKKNCPAGTLKEDVIVNVLECTSLAKSELTDEVLVFFPNPVNDELWIDTKLLLGPFELSLTNSIGMVVYSLKFNGSEHGAHERISLAWLPAGIYSAEIKDSKIKRVRKLIKQ